MDKEMQELELAAAAPSHDRHPWTRITDEGRVNLYAGTIDLNEIER